MYLTRSEYDRGVNTFSPEGRLFQVEYAIEAIKLGSTAIGLQTKYGCVLAVEKRLTSSLLEPKSVEKIAEIDCHIGAAMSGLVADARTLVDHARVEAQNHRFTYDEPIGVEALTQGKSVGMFAAVVVVLVLFVDAFSSVLYALVFSVYCFMLQLVRIPYPSHFFLSLFPTNSLCLLNSVPLPLRYFDLSFSTLSQSSTCIKL